MSRFIYGFPEICFSSAGLAGFLSDFVAYIIIQGLYLGIFLNPKSLSAIVKMGIRGFSEVLPKGNQL